MPPAPPPWRHIEEVPHLLVDTPDARGSLRGVLPSKELRMPIEKHRSDRIGWLRAAVLGANDGIVSTASLVIGVAAAAAARSDVLVAGVAGLVAGAMSMAAGEYVSVSSQSDTERADEGKERRELADSPGLELQELQQIYVKRGLDAGLALRVAEQLTESDALATHLRDELGGEVCGRRSAEGGTRQAAVFCRPDDRGRGEDARDIGSNGQTLVDIRPGLVA
jgi:VIT1/CCC1 family predicted Fe2+/Mn2+ transporter